MESVEINHWRPRTSTNLLGIFRIVKLKQEATILFTLSQFQTWKVFLFINIDVIIVQLVNDVYLTWIIIVHGYQIVLGSQIENFSCCSCSISSLLWLFVSAAKFHCLFLIFSMLLRANQWLVYILYWELSGP